MMRTIFKSIVILLCFVSHAQNNKKITIEWNGVNNYKNEEYTKKFPMFSSENYEIDLSNKILFFSDIVVSSQSVKASSLTVSNVITESISLNELYDLDLSKIPNTINAKIESVKAREEFIYNFRFSPIFKVGNDYKKIISLNYSFEYDNNSKLAQSTILAVSNSVLATGNWYRFYINKSGIYVINKQFLQNLGFNVNVDPRTIKIYGNGGNMLPLLNSSFTPTDLIENAIQFNGENDGVFDDGDAIVFYGQGTDNWNEESLTKNNLFTDKSYYYITSGSGLGKRIQNEIQPTGASSLDFTKYDSTVIYEKDLVNVGKVGRRWFGEQFNIEDTQNFDFSIPNLDLSTPIDFKINLASKAFGSSSFQAKANNVSIGAVSFNSVVPFGGVQGYENIIQGSFSATSPNISVELKYSNGGVPSSIGYLDFISLKTKRNLTGFGSQFSFYNEQQETNIGIGQYTITNASGISSVWDVSDLFNVKRVTNLNANNANYNFKVNLGTKHNYVAVVSSDLYVPQKDESSTVANQNLKGTIFNNSNGSFQDIDYLIIAPRFLVNQAERLANFHRNYSQLNVKVVSLESIYTEFSSGKQDVAAIRNFIKYVYFNASNVNNRVKYVNLFGDASYDYKNRLFSNNNVVPIFHGFYPNAGEINNVTNMSLFNSFMSDDFFGLMDDDEGPMVNSIDGIDIAVGRMIVSNDLQAQQMVNKVIEYHDKKSYGRWRNSYVVYSDDADNNVDATLQFGLDNLANTLVAQKPFVNVKKIHTDAYIQEVAAGGERYPQAKGDFLDAMALGSLVFNYFGHGNEDFLARERLFEKIEAQNLTNRYRYPLFITITCEFTRFDDPNRTSGGEFMYLNASGGAIALIATTRQIGVNTGLVMNDFLNEELYAFGSTDYPSIAEALRRVKLRPGTSSNRRVVSYIGDPALKLAIPKQKVILTKVNDVPIASFTGTFQALALMKIEGQVVDENNVLITNYNGDLAVQIFDKDLNRATLGNDGVTNSSGLIIMNFTTLGETIFRGNASVVNGVFSFSFVVPQDIKIPIGSGKISFYAEKNTPSLDDQTGYNRDILIGGVNVNAPTDNNPPKVRLYLNDESFVSGGITNCSPILLAFLEDENGINTASGIGHDIVAILDGDEINPYILNDYYETENDNYTKGFVRFPFRDLAPGLHTLLFKAWDVYNNLITIEIQFVSVCGSENLVLEKVLNYPNPFVDYTEFWFSHNRPFEPLDVQVQILTISGKLVKTINQQIVNEGFLSRDITWDGRDDFGDKIGKGVYIYKLTVKSTTSSAKAQKIEKLVIL